MGNHKPPSQKLPPGTVIKQSGCERVLKRLRRFVQQFAQPKRFKETELYSLGSTGHLWLKQVLCAVVGASLNTLYVQVVEFHVVSSEVASINTFT